jgi:DnaB-like helicase N terminal domain/AAA domain
VTATPTDRLYNPDAEQVVLGAIFIQNSLYCQVAKVLRPDDFGNSLHSRIFEAAAHLIRAGQTATPVTLRNQFDIDQTLANGGGIEYLAQLAAAAAVVVHPLDYAHNIVDLARRRQIIAHCEETARQASLVDHQRPASLVIEEHALGVEAIRRRALPVDYAGVCTKAANWLQREMTEPDFLLGHIISTTSRMLLVAPTGLGKTNFGMALGATVADGANFLHWRGSGCQRRVLFIDGEMSRRLTRRRLDDTMRRLGVVPEAFHLLCCDDIDDMRPLDTAAGQKYVDGFIESVGGFDLIIFDNVQALLTPGDNYGADSWDRTLPWVRDLTRRSVGQVWIHHTGANETRSYGTTTREWQMDAVCLLERFDDAGSPSDIAFRFSFSKARERTPDNRADFEPAIITLANDEWSSERGNVPNGKKAPQKDRALELLEDEINRGGIVPPANLRIPPGTPCIEEAQWRQRCKAGCISEGTDEANNRAFRRAASKLIEAGQVGKHSPWVWIVPRRRLNGAHGLAGGPEARTADNRTPL